MAELTRTIGRGEQRGEQRAAGVRLKRPSTSTDRFAPDMAAKPDDMDYQWNVQTVLGQDQREQQVSMARFHWTPVPASRHPELSGYREGGNVPADAAIIVGGQMLCERPQYLTDEAREEDRQKTQFLTESKVSMVMDQGPAGTAPRNNAGKPIGSGLKRSYSRPIPGDDS